MAAPVSKHKPLLHPAYWLTWLGVALFWLVGQLPLRVLLPLGRLVGQLAWLLGTNRRHIAQTNIDLCFPELDEQARRELCHRTLISTGEALTELACSMCNHRIDLSKRLTVKGIEHMHAARAGGRGVLMLGMHFNTLDSCARMLASVLPYCAVYRPNDNAVIDLLIDSGRRRYLKHTVDRQDIRQLVRLLKKGEVIWYAPDQDYGRKHAVYVPFFGQTAATITATSRLVRMSGAAVVPCAHYRLPGGRYVIEFGPALDPFPLGDDTEDATLINNVIEHYVRKAPEQYLWVHRRFKHQPDGNPSPYKKTARK